MANAQSIEFETWMPVVGYEGIYEVSDLGRVRRTGKAHGATRGLVLAQSLSWRSYPCVCLSCGHKSRKFTVHRLVADAFLGPCPDGHEVNHIDGNKSNPVVTNLEYVTRTGNMKHAYGLGLMEPSRGEDNSRSKLTEGDIRMIRSSNEPHTVLAEQLGVSAVHILHIRKRQRWAHVGE